MKGAGNVMDFGARLLGTREGRFFSVDPLAAKYPGESAFSSFGNNPIIYIDPDGREIKFALSKDDRSTFMKFVNSSKVLREQYDALDAHHHTVTIAPRGGLFEQKRGINMPPENFYYKPDSPRDEYTGTGDGTGGLIFIDMKHLYAALNWKKNKSNNKYFKNTLGVISQEFGHATDAANAHVKRGLSPASNILWAEEQAIQNYENRVLEDIGLEPKVLYNGKILKGAPFIVPAPKIYNDMIGEPKYDLDSDIIKQILNTNNSKGNDKE